MECYVSSNAEKRFDTHNVEQLTQQQRVQNYNGFNIVMFTIITVHLCNINIDLIHYLF